jgi:hypothetical protein
MNDSIGKAIGVAILCAPLVGCCGPSVHYADNAQRVILQGADANFCAEPVAPDQAPNDAAGNVMQFSQSSLYRLCEATANGYIPKTEYPQYYTATLLATTALWCVQSQTNQSSTAAAALETARNKHAAAADAKKSADEKVAKAQLEFEAETRKFQDAVKPSSGARGKLEEPPSELRDGSKAARERLEVAIKAEATAATAAMQAQSDLEAADRAATAAQADPKTPCAGAMSQAAEKLGELFKRSSEGRPK